MPFEVYSLIKGFWSLWGGLWLWGVMSGVTCSHPGVHVPRVSKGFVGFGGCKISDGFYCSSCPV